MTKQLDYYSRYAAIKAIRFYQRTLSFDHGFMKIYFPHGYCRFKPTCSEYSILAIEKYGVLKGGLMSFWRVLRCNPWSKGGWDKP